MNVHPDGEKEVPGANCSWLGLPMPVKRVFYLTIFGICWA